VVFHPLASDMKSDIRSGNRVFRFWFKFFVASSYVNNIGLIGL
jgi:hypothetical protein